MQVLRATHLGMCFGVRDAIALALERADAGPLTILGDLVHNPTVLTTLRAKGISVAQDAAQVRTSTLMVTAHGTSNRTLERTRALGLTVVEATCPLVRAALGYGVEEKHRFYRVPASNTAVGHVVYETKS